MSLAFATMRTNVRLLMKDTDKSDYVVKTDELNREIVRKLQLLQGEGRGFTIGWVGGITLAAGERTATAAALANAAMIQDIKLDDRDEPLLRWTEAEIERAAQGTTAPVGRPRFYWISEDSSQYPILSFDCAADREYIVAGLAVKIPADSATNAISVSDYILRAIEAATAATCIAKMTGDDRSRLKINADVIQDYRQDAADFVKLERERVVKLQSVAHIAPAVY